MHELAICQALVGQIESIARREAAARVTAIHVAIGPLSGVEPELLSRAWPLAAAGTIAEEAALALTPAEVRVVCSVCGSETAATANRLLCAECGDWRTRLTSGDEMLLTRVELERSRPVPRAAGVEEIGHV